MTFAGAVRGGPPSDLNFIVKILTNAPIDESSYSGYAELQTLRRSAKLSVR